MFVLTLFHSIRRVIKKKQSLLSGYEKSHRHFLWYVALDAALSVALVVGGFQVAHAGSSWKASVTKYRVSGAPALSADQVINLAHSEQLEVFWLGSISGVKYSFEVKPGVGSTLTYLGDVNRRIQDYDLPKLTIQNYDTYGTYAENLHPILVNGVQSTLDSPNFTLHFDSDSMKRSTIVYKDSTRVTVITYPVKHSESSLINDAESLALM
jgi:hypothetical protein